MKAALTFKNQPVQFTILTEKKETNFSWSLQWMWKMYFIKFGTHSYFKKS